MTAPPFKILWTPEATDVMKRLKKRDDAKYKKAQKAARWLRDIGPSHPGLQTHKYHNMSGPNGEDVWESYVENRTPGAWRIWWMYGPGADTLTIVTLGAHP